MNEAQRKVFDDNIQECRGEIFPDIIKVEDVEDIVDSVLEVGAPIEMTWVWNGLIVNGERVGETYALRGGRYAGFIWGHFVSSADFDTEKDARHAVESAFTEWVKGVRT